MNMKRLMTLLLALVMMLSLAACGGSGEKEAEPTAEPAADETAAEAENAADETAEEAESAADETAEEAESAADETETADSEQFRVGMECAYAPYNWQETEQSDTNVAIENVPGAYAEGYDVQIARIIADSLDRELVIVKLSWDGLIEALNQGQIDAIIAGMLDTPERKEAINFSVPYQETVYAMMVNQDSPYADATSIQDFAGASVLGQKGTALDTVIDQIEGVDHLTPAETVPDQVSRLQQGTCDAIVINLENAKGYMETNPEFKVIEFEEGNGFVLESRGVSVGLRKSDTELLDQVNAVLEPLDQATREDMWATAESNMPK